MRLSQQDKPDGMHTVVYFQGSRALVAIYLSQTQLILWACTRTLEVPVGANYVEVQKMVTKKITITYTASCFCSCISVGFATEMHELQFAFSLPDVKAG